ncbi:MAG: hypothetical protein ACP5II_03220 [Infirmifilum sp.]|jgi:hypothetical protein|uniref:Roadblock/LAMTOR2 domain-containing protein n=1 Tax=Infirmifilum uzonense TaxID=1550241 RepID=A0A0F7CL44_9CREN|nr:hypothetical protein [Infirmifilum uzonense]AKG38766.1 hypothetical protein MA03_05050 [Infirmifilum uzonense]
MSSKPVLEVFAEDEDVLKSLKSLGVSRIVAFNSDKILYQYPPKVEVSDLLAYVRSTLTVLGYSDPWLALKQGSKSVLIFKRGDLLVAVEGVINPADFDVIVMLVSLLIS